MRLPVTWLSDYIDTRLSAEKLAEMLTMSGTAVERIEKKNGEDILHIEVTTNRPDCLSILGLAQEVHALTSKKIKLPDPVLPRPKKTKADVAKSIRIDIQDKKGCPRYTARIIENLEVKASPVKIQKILDWMGARAISNVVDATNFILFETGQPMHAFDLDKIRGGVVIVRRSKKGEKFLGLDGVEYELDDETLVIADSERPIAIAGVMGGKLTEVTPTTKSILLESAYFDAAMVRKAARKYKLSTESSYRFERGTDIEKVVPASDRALDILSDWAGGTETDKLIDKDYSKTIEKKYILLRADRIEKVLGMKVAYTRIGQILKSLGFSVQQATRNNVRVAAQNSRKDIGCEADLIEEILRIDGFDKVPPAIPMTRHAYDAGLDRKPEEKLELKKYLAANGFDEVVTYSLLSKKVLTDSGFETDGSVQRIVNAVSAEQEWVRPSLLPGILGSIVFNIHRKALSLRLFEMGNRYLNGQEDTVLAIALYGAFEENWRRKSAVSFYELKGVVESVLDFLRVKNYEWQGESIFKNGKEIGKISVVSPTVLKKWDIPQEVFFAEVYLDKIEKDETVFRVRTLPKFPSVRRDIAFIIDEKTPVSALEAAMKKAASPHVQEIQLFDEYSGKNIPTGKRSLAFSLSYQKDSGTFTEDEILDLQKRVGDTLKNEFSVEFR